MVVKSLKAQSVVDTEVRTGEVFRPIHYLGSKLRLLTDIADAVNAVSSGNGVICDLFSGSGVVSSFLAQKRPLIAVDIQEYARVLASSAFLATTVEVNEFIDLLDCRESKNLKIQLIHAFSPLIEYEEECVEKARQGNSESLAELIELGSLVTAGYHASSNINAKKAFARVVDNLNRSNLNDAGLISRYYGGLYFNYEHAIHIDVLLSKVPSLPRELQDLGKGIALSTASDLVRTVGKQFAQPLRPRSKSGVPKPSLWKVVQKSRQVGAEDVTRNWIQKYLNRPHTVSGSIAVRDDYRQFLRHSSLPIEVVYADPPYTRDHYSRFYHVLETICLRDQPKLSRTNLNGGMAVSRGAYRIDRHQSPFCIRSQAPNAFNELFDLVSKRGSNLVLSYSPQAEGASVHPRVMKLETILELAGKFFKEIETQYSNAFLHSKLNRSDLHLQTPETSEVLLVCRNH
jgi:adenine-specific DNA methylase